VEEDERGTYIFNSRDLCLLNRLPELVAAGVDSLKIEGRMKSVGYVGGVVRVYRAALDWIGERLGTGASVAGLTLPEYYADEILKFGTRGQTENFFAGPPAGVGMLFDRTRLEQEWAPVGIVSQADPLVIETRNVLEIGDLIEYMGCGFVTVGCTVTGMAMADGAPIYRANPGQTVRLTTDPPVPEPEQLCLIRKRIRR